MRKYVPPFARLVPPQAMKVFAGEIFDVYQWPQELYDGSTATFEMLRRADTVKIIALVTPEEQKRCNFYNTLDETGIVITKQEQPTKPSFYDYPGGRVDETDQDEMAAAQRELREETGLSFKNWKLVDVRQPFNKIDWLVYTFVASGLIDQQEQNLDGGERIEVQVASIPEIMQLAQNEDSKYLRFKEYKNFASADELLGLPALCEY